MPEITLQWIDESQNVLQVNYPKNYTWEDYHDVLDRVDGLLGEQPQPVTFINVYEPGAMPPRSAPDTHWKRTVRKFTIHYVVYVTQDKMLKAVLRTFLHTIDFREGRNYSFEPSVAEAVRLLNLNVAVD